MSSTGTSPITFIGSASKHGFLPPPADARPPRPSTTTAPVDGDFELSLTTAPALRRISSTEVLTPIGEKPKRKGGRPLSTRTKFVRVISILNEHLPPTSSSASLVPTTSLPAALAEQLSTTPHRAIGRTLRLTKKWEKLTDEQRSLPIMMGMMHSGHAYAFSLNLSRGVMAKADGLLENARDYIRNRLSRELHALPGERPAFVMIMERDKSGRLHLHGTIQTTTATQKEIKVALRRAGGCWDSIAGSKFQAKVTPLQTVGGWHSYVVKELRRFTQKGVKQHLSISHAARRLGRKHYEQLLRPLMDDNKTPRTVH